MRSIRIGSFIGIGVLAAASVSAQIITTAVGTLVPSGVPATSVSLSYTFGVAVDSSGNRFIALGNPPTVYKLDAVGVLTVYAGNGMPGYSGDGGPATSAQLNYPNGLAIDGAGNLFIADALNSVIRRVDASTHIITTYAGNGTYGYSGDGGPATSSQLAHPIELALDSSANLFIADPDNNAMRRVDASTHIITTYAGNGTFGYSGDGGAAISAQLGGAWGVALDSSGNLFIADTNNQAVRRVDAGTQIITTYAGTGKYGYSGDGGLATSAQLGYPEWVSVDGAGNLFIADTSYGVVRRVDASTQKITTYAGNGTRGYSGDGGLATAAQMNYPQGLAVDGSNDLFIADLFNNVIRRVDGNTLDISTDAGNGQSSYSGDGGPATSAQLFCPAGVAFDGGGNLFIADACNNVIRRVDATTTDISTYAGTGTSGYSGDGGAASAAELDYPLSVAVDRNGNVFIGDRDHYVIRRVDAVTQNIMTVAGNGTCGYSGDGGPATSAQLCSGGGPVGSFGLALDSNGNLFIADNGNSVIRRVDAKTQNISTFAGNGTRGYSGDGGAATSAELGCPMALAFDGSNNLFIGDLCSNVVRRVDASTQIVTTYAGNGTYGNSGDGGPASGAELRSPMGLALDGNGNLFIADLDSYVIRRVDSVTQNISTYAGNGVFGYSGDGGVATLAQLAEPFGISLDGGGNLFIGDFANNVIRKVTVATSLDHFDVTSSTDTPTAGSPFSVTVTAKDTSGNTVTNYRGTVHFSLKNPDSGAVLPGDYSFVSADNGIHTFTNAVTLSVPGSQTINVNDTTQTNKTGSANVVVSQETTTISISNIPTNAVYGGGFTPTYAYVGDGTPSVTSSTTSTCTISGSVVSFVGAGTCTLTANATAGTNYAAATGNPQSFTIAQAQASVSISDIPANAVFGGSFTAAYAYTGDGTTSVTSSTASTCTVSGNVVNFVGGGTCTLTAHATAGTNYAAATGSPQSFTISPAMTTISINDVPTNAVFSGTFTATYAYTGNGIPSVTSSTTSTCTSSGSTVNFVGVGTCTLTAHATATANYAAATGNPQSFTIAQLKPTISINNIPALAQFSGSFAPTYTYPGDGTTSVTSGTTTTCMVSGSVVNFVGRGTCTLTAHATATANSAAATGTPQSFNIVQATPTISINNIPSSASYGASFTPTYSYTGNGKTSTTSSTSNTCTVSSKGVVTFVGLGTCTLTAHATATTNYAAATGTPQSFTIAQATTTISIKNIPNSAKTGGSFTITYNYIGDGTPSTTSNTPTTCSVSGTLVNFLKSGTCTLTAQATAGTNYAATTGSPQSFTIK